MAIDPVCKMEVEETMARYKSVFEGKTYYFCAEGCKEEFEANPRRYVDSDTK